MTIDIENLFRSHRGKKLRFRETESGCYECVSHQPRCDGYVRIRHRADGDIFPEERPLHRIVHELCNGPLPPHWHVDHMCRNKLCCNPEHLQALDPVTHGQKSSAEGLGLTIEEMEIRQGAALWLLWDNPKITQEKVADLLSVEQQTVSKWTKQWTRTWKSLREKARTASKT